jgi:hypothetical protein
VPRGVWTGGGSGQRGGERRVLVVGDAAEARVDGIALEQSDAGHHWVLRWNDLGRVSAS